MKNPTIRFADLECLLQRFGFQRYQLPEGQIVFENRAENSMLAYPAYKQDKCFCRRNAVRTEVSVDYARYMSSVSDMHRA